MTCPPNCTCPLCPTKTSTISATIPNWLFGPSEEEKKEIKKLENKELIKKREKDQNKFRSRR